MSFLLVLTTAGSLPEAAKLSDLLLNHRLAACVSALPGLHSRYWWKGKKEKGREVLLLIKTRASLFPKLRKVILQNHSYSLPEIIAFPVKKGSSAYLNWILQETSKSKIRN